MRLKNLTQVYIYTPNKEKVSGEYTIISWTLKSIEWLNPQQDLDELNRNSAGIIDYEIFKLRTDKVLDIEKGDGVSFEELKLDQNNRVINTKPQYIVENTPTIGKTTIYTLVTNTGG